MAVRPPSRLGHAVDNHLRLEYKISVSYIWNHTHVYFYPRTCTTPYEPTRLSEVFALVINEATFLRGIC